MSEVKNDTGSTASHCIFAIAVSPFISSASWMTLAAKTEQIVASRKKTKRKKVRTWHIL